MLSVALIYNLSTAKAKRCTPSSTIKYIDGPSKPSQLFLAITDLESWSKLEDAAPVAGIEELPLTAPPNRLGGRD